MEYGEGVLYPVRRLATSLHYPNGMPGLRAGLSLMWSQPPLHSDPNQPRAGAAIFAVIRKPRKALQFVLSRRK
jgi:hypothetical protein